MTTAFTATAIVDRPAPEVWERLTGWTWLPGVENVRVDGATLAFRSRGKERTARIEIVTPGQLVVVHSVQGGVLAAYKYECEADGGRTKVTVTADLRAGGWWRPFGGLLRAAVRRADARQLDALTINRDDAVRE